MAEKSELYKKGTAIRSKLMGAKYAEKMNSTVYDVALHRLPVVFCLDRAGVTGPDGASHHGMYDLALLSKVPGMRVLAPSSAQDLRQMLNDAIPMLDAGPTTENSSSAGLRP